MKKVIRKDGKVILSLLVADYEGEIYIVEAAAKRPLLFMLRGPGLQERNMLGVTDEQSRGLLR